MADGLDVVALGAACSYTDEQIAPVATDVANMKNLGRFLSMWNASTGLPESSPSSTLPYTYKTGDYYRVGTVAASGGTNYKPNGSSYSEVASTVVESASINNLSIYFYDGTQWLLQANGGGGTVQDVRIAGTTILDSGTGVANFTSSNITAIANQIIEIEY